MTVPTTATAPVAPTSCTSCTVPTDRPDGLCAFCADPPPPLDPAYHPSLLHGATNHATMALEDIDDQLAALPTGASMWLTVDLVRAQRHLRAAVRLIEQVGAQLDTEAVAR